MPQETDQDRDELSVIYREASEEQPPAELDAAILAAAGKALIPWYRRPATAAISTAAVVILAVGLIVDNPDLGVADNESFSISEKARLPDSPDATGLSSREVKPVNYVSNKPVLEAAQSTPAEELPLQEARNADVKAKPLPVSPTASSTLPVPITVDEDSPRQRSDISASAPPPPVNQLRREELVQPRRAPMESQQQTFSNLAESTDNVTDSSVAVEKRVELEPETSTSNPSFGFGASSSSRGTDTAQIEEIITTAAYLTLANGNCADGRLQRLTPREAAPLVICSFPDYSQVHAEGCDSPYRIDPAVTATVYRVGIELTGAGTAFRLRCERGRWFNVALPVQPTVD